MIASVRLQRPALSVPYWGMAAHAGPSEPRSGDESHDIDVVHTTYTPKEDRVGAAAAAPAVAATDAVGAAAPQPGNFVRDAQPGCHVAFSASALSYVRSAPGASAAAVAAIAAAGGSGGAARDASSSHGCGHGAAHPETPQLEAPPTWIVGSSPFDPDDYGLDEDEISSVPDLSLDPESGLLACLNTSTKVRSYFLSLGHPCRDVSGELLSVGSARDSDGRVSPVVTIVAVLGPHETMELCYVDVSARLAAASGGGSGGAGGGGKSRKARRRRKQKAKAAASADAGDGEVDLYSDVQDVDFSSILKAARSGACAALDGGLPVVGWPLAARELAGEGGGVALSCSQGCGGSFTHFFPGTYHAVDIACPIGTPCVAVGDGEVLEVRQNNTSGGCHARALFEWNSVQIKLDSGLVFEYVHIKAGSARVAPGDRVVAGQAICESGDVGFCPTPHLHVQAHSSVEPDAPTIAFAFERDGEPVFPAAGEQYEQRV